MTEPKKLILTAAILVGSCGFAAAQSADALIDKLVDKGILTVKEANNLREEADKNFTTAFAAKNGMPEWVTALKFNGDFRGRYEGIYNDNPASVDRTRWRYRARFGITVSIQNSLEAGLRLGSGDLDGGVPTGGIDPISQNQTLQNNGSKKGIFVDLAYAKWSPVNNATWSSTLTIGKMENPFVFSDMVFDADYTPEGAAFQLGYNLSDKHALKLNSGGFVLDELSYTSRDPFLIGVQGRCESTWTPKFSTSLGIAYLDIENSDRLDNASVPNINVGNTRVVVPNLDPNSTATLFGPAYEFRPVIADVSATFTLGSFPFYEGAFPIKFGGDYMNNTAAAAAANNYAWSLGATFGKAGKKGTWELAYTYKWLGADAWWEELVDSDFGAYYSTGPINSGKTIGLPGGGYYSGTNVRGHIVKFSYSPTDSLTLSAKVFLTQLIDTTASTLTPPILDTRSDSRRLQIDATLKF